MQKINFKNLPDTSTPLSAENLNLMQDNIETAINSIELSGGGDEVGTVKMFSGSTAPQGWLICDGSAISRSEYAELFSAIGTTYGSGNGTTTFNIPNIKGRTVVGLDSNDSDFDTLGNTLGEKTHTLTINEMPSHSHNFNGGWGTGSVGEKYSYGSVNTASTYGVENTGGGQPHNIIQPSIVLNYIIKASATTTTQGQIIDSLDSDSTTDAPSVHAVNEIINNLNNYSNEEIIVGTFFDKPKYRKCFKINGSLSTISTGISDMEDLVDLRILVKDTSNGYWRPIPWTFNDSSYNSSFTGGVIISSTGNSIIFQAGNGLTNTSKYIAILEYTKTTD